jgi:transcriptional regulator of arginine metabolism
MTTRAARLHLLTTIITGGRIRSQAELVTALAQSGIQVTQATLSRDLDVLGAVKVHDSEGAYYAIPEDGTGELGQKDSHRLSRILSEHMASAEHSGNLVVLRTQPGAASYLASALDRSGLHSIIGTIAGDDTVMVVTRDPAGGPAVCHELTELASK